MDEIKLKSVFDMRDMIVRWSNDFQCFVIGEKYFISRTNAKKLAEFLLGKEVKS